MQGEQHPTLGSILDACYEEALRQYRREYAGHVRVEDLFANHVRSVRMASNTYPDGIVDVMVKVVARRPSAGEVYFTKAQRVAGTYYIL